MSHRRGKKIGRHGTPSCPVLATLHFQSEELIRVTLELSSSFHLAFRGVCVEKRAVVRWFDAFLEGDHLAFPLKLAVSFSPFYSRVYQALGAISFGETKSYQEVAVKAGSPKGARAVGNACNVNPFPLLIPCHRVLKSDGSIGGFAYGESVKRELLGFEKRSSESTSS